jgi:chaperonin GroES
MEQEKLGALLESLNIAEKLEDDQLAEIGEECKKGFDQDFASCSDWMKSCDDWLKLAKQTIDQKTYPWPGASNVKYPLLSTAAMQFAARAYPSLVPSDGRVVKAKVIGKDPDGSKTNVAEAVSIYMSYQLMYEMEGWEEDMDKLLITLPIVGTMFKKTYWDSMKKVNCSRVVMPNRLVVDYWTDSLCAAERISEILEISPRKVKEKQQSGLWRDVDLGEATAPEGEHNPPALDAITPYEFVEQHTYLDLDDDGYREPYIVTFQRKTGKIVRISARFDEDTIFTDDEGELIAIEPVQYYTKFGFVPNPDGSFYDIGFGVLLGPLNESVNTLINQLVDAGHLASLQSGFLGKGLRLRAGEQRFTPGEWKVVNATGDDLKKQVVPLPAAEPSKVLLELMTTLVTSGKELASVAEIFTGKMPGQNTPATTTMATVEQGMKVFTAVYKRIYRSLSEEFKKLYRLNALYLNPTSYQDVVDMAVGQEDFKVKGYQIYPGADPTAVSQTERLLKAQGLVELMPMFPGMMNPVEVVNRVLEAQEQPNKEALMSQEVMQSGQWQPPPDPKQAEMQMKGQMEQQKIQQQGMQKQQEMELESRDRQEQLMMEKEAHAQEMQHEQEMAAIRQSEALHKQRIFQVEGAQKVMHKEQDHQQKLRQGEEQSKAKVAQTKAQAKAKPKAKGPTKK